MVYNHIKIARRRLLKSKVSSFINIGGLAVGMAVAMLISLWIFDELSYNKYHKSYNRVARVLRQITLNTGQTYTGLHNPLPMSSALRLSHGEDFELVAASTFTEDHILAFGENKFNQSGNFIEPEGPELLSLQMIQGSRDGLKDIHSILLAESVAKKLFGNREAVNQIIRIDNQSDLKVAGVYKELPFNSDFKKLGFVATLDFYASTRPWMKRDDWQSNVIQVLVQLSPNVDLDKVSNKIRDIMPKNPGQQVAVPVIRFFLHPMKKWHLYEEFKQGVNTGGRIQFVRLFGIIGVFILLLACINFMNLSTARSEKSAKEVGIRKSIGSLRIQLISQFLNESLLVAACAFVLSIGLVLLILPWFNQLANKEIRILWTSPIFWLAAIGFTFLTGLIAGSYPAIYLSSFEPVNVLKGTFKAGRFSAVPRKALVVLQFTVSVALVIGTLLVYRQVQFTKNRSLGYNTDRLIYLSLKTKEIHEHIHAVRNELISTGAVIEIAESNGFISREGPNWGGYQWKGKDPNLMDNFVADWVSYEYGKTVGWQFVAGRDFSKEFATDSSAYIINEAAAKYMNLENPVGEYVRTGDGKSFKIIGVIKDVIADSPYKPVRPTFASILQWPGGALSIRLNSRIPVHEALAKIEPVFKKHAPAMPFDYKFADEEYAAKFEAEQRIGALSGFFSILAVLISCMGLFGLASYVAEQRTREIGVRKILGASAFNLWQMISGEFLVLVVWSCLIAVPIAYYFLHGWLQNYEYRAEISWWIFAFAVIGALSITLLTVSFQAIKAALINPVKSLRTE